MNKKKTTGVLLLILVLLASMLTGCSGGAQSDNGEIVYGNSVAELTGSGYIGMNSAYTGVVEAQKTEEVRRDSDKTIGEIFVKEGQSVRAGDPLFTYDVEALNLTIQQGELELEGMRNAITQYQSQIAQLTQEKAKAPAADQLSYTLQIQSLQLDQRTAEYNLTIKESEQEKLTASVENAVVTCEIDGIVKTVKENASYEEAFISILSDGDYRVKGTASELSVGGLYEGMYMTVRSRVNQDQTWAASVVSIDREAAQENNNMYYGPENGNQASKYYFYLMLEDTEGLMLGQHVYIEAGEVVEPKSGLWLPEYYIVMDETPYVWGDNGKGKLEKKTVELGEYDPMEGSYEILSGLTEADIITFPDDTLTEGTTIKVWADAEEDM